MKVLATFVIAFASAAISAGELPDPTRPPALTSAPSIARVATVGRAARVTAVFVSSSRRAAVLDGKVVQCGDRVGDCLVEEILEDGVRCRTVKGTTIERLPRRESAFKKKPAQQSVAAANGVQSP